MSAPPLSSENEWSSIEEDTDEDDEQIIEERAIIESPEMPSSVTTSAPEVVYSIVGDNIDKKVKPRYMRAGHGNRDLHYFHCYAVRDRVDNSLSTSPPKLPPRASADTCAFSILPSIDDDRVTRENMIIVVSRVLATHMESRLGLDCTKLVKWHIDHNFKIRCRLNYSTNTFSTHTNITSIYLHSFVYSCTAIA